MPNSVLDQTTLEESFFFCEYAKRRFAMSCYNTGEIENTINIVGKVLEAHYEEKSVVPYPMKMDFLSDVIYCCEAMGINILMMQFGGVSFETMNLAFKHLREQIVQVINNISNIGILLDIASRFSVSPSFLPFPYKMEDVVLNYRANNELPAVFKCRDIVERKCVVKDCNNSIMFLVNAHMSLKETINELTRQATLFKSNSYYENCERSDVIKEVHRLSKSGSYRQTLQNIFYKATGLIIYDFCVLHNENLESALERHSRSDKSIKCDPLKKSTTTDCIQCKYYSECRNMWTKQFKYAVEKIRGTQTAEEWMNLTKKISDANKLQRRTIGFFEYEFVDTAT